MSPHLLRRFYLYTATFAGLQAVIWGAVLLIRARLPGYMQLDAGQVQIATALLLVGLPVFLVHAAWVQWLAGRDLEERASLTRGLCLYGIQFASSVAVLWNGLALLDRWMLSVLGLSSGSPAWQGILAAILINGAAVVLATLLLRRDWRTIPAREDFAAARRLSRYAWLLSGLVLALLGMQQILLALFLVLEGEGRLGLLRLVNGLALLLPGAPLLAYTDRRVRQSLANPDERQSLLRLVTLHVAVLSGIAGLLVAAVWTLRGILLIVLGEPFTTREYLGRFDIPLSLLVPGLYLLWRYGRTLQLEMKAPPALPGSDATSEEAPIAASRLSPLTVKRATLHQRHGLRRLYFYLLALLGLGAVSLGLWSLLLFLVELAVAPFPLTGSELRETLAGALAGLLVGAPVWWKAWTPMQREAAPENEAGEIARRSLARRFYLVSVLAAGTVGLGLGAGRILVQNLDVLAEGPGVIRIRLLQEAQPVLLFVLLLVYHGFVHWRDQRRLARGRARRHAKFPVLVLAPDDPATGEFGASGQDGAVFGSFAGTLVSALQRKVPALPVAVHYYSQGAPNETLSAARAVILPAELVARPPEAIRLWLQAFNGRRLVLPTPARGWHWVNSDGKRISHLARQAARDIRKFAEES